ncbi:hypothetical protein SRHO_G00256720 [Serrasalmus rhombeus]
MTLLLCPCSERCSGLVRWSEFSKSTDVLAECDQTSCRSVKEGYQMIHDQYLKGDFSLIITDADFTKRGLYTSDCDALRSPIQIKPGKSLMLKLEISDPVEVIYNSTDKRSEEVIHIHTVSVGSAGGGEKKDDHPDLDTDRGAAVPVWAFALMMAALLTVIVASAVVIVLLRRKVLQRCIRTERI